MLSARHRLLCGCLLILASGCAPHLPQTYRLTEGKTRILTPPGVATAEATQGVFILTLSKDRPPCTPSADAIAAQRKSGKLRVQVARDTLQQQPAGWLRQWS